jgi:hypothetical protein
VRRSAHGYIAVTLVRRIAPGAGPSAMTARAQGPLLDPKLSLRTRSLLSLLPVDRAEAARTPLKPSTMSQTHDYCMRGNGIVSIPAG